MIVNKLLFCKSIWTSCGCWQAAQSNLTRN